MGEGDSGDGASLSEEATGRGLGGQLLHWGPWKVR